MDTLTPERRSWNMSRIRGKNTRPELTVRSLLHRMGYRFRLHNTTLPGKPDIVLPRYKTVVFVHGCFWHRHPGCRYAYTPKTRLQFWQRKFDSNVRRDQQAARQLTERGWNQLTLWECQIGDTESLRRNIDDFFRDL
jgi:DNA mismatch endonuclease, patch repair protein